MARAKKTREAKEAVVNVRLTAQQKATLEAVAAREGLGLSTWILQAALLKADGHQAKR